MPGEKTRMRSATSDGAPGAAARNLDRRGVSMHSKTRGRRKFLKQSAVAALAVGSAKIARVQAQALEAPAEAPSVASDLLTVRAYGQRSRFETAVRETAVPQ